MTVAASPQSQLTGGSFSQTKTYYMVDDEDPILERAEGTEIQWKSGKNLTVKIMKKKPKKGGRGSGKPLTKTEPCESFFNFFSPPKVLWLLPLALIPLCVPGWLQNA